MREPVVLLESYSAERDRASFAFSGFCGEVAACVPEEVRPALEAVERAVAGGRHAAGFLSYEAAPGLDSVLKTRPGGALPLVWFGLFRERTGVAPGGLDSCGGYSLSAWQPSVSRAAYGAAIGRIGAYIEAGDTYQVNFTFRMRADFEGDDRALYRDLCRSQRAPYTAYLNTGRFRILSASPELFFALKNGRLTARPMKGTGRRGRWVEEDDALASALQGSSKDRAENVMIVDLLRNDMGRVAALGHVTVPRLWEVERYETVLQMTSTVTSRLRPGTALVDLLTALFPCGSVTGAPKVRTMEIISEVEDSPRGVYTGSIGFFSPGPEARFNVAIRTVWIDSETGRGEFGVGGGVTHDSSPEGEYEECLVKAQVLTVRRPEFELLETLRFEAGEGFWLLDRHLGRLRNSARYFGFPCDVDAVVKALLETAAGLQDGAHRVRLILARDGGVHICARALPPGGDEAAMRVGICNLPVDERDPMLFHKTTCRQIYEARRCRRPDCDEVVLVNERGEATECCIGNLVAVLDGEKVTPPVRCGLLPGTFRAELLATGEICEGVLRVEDLHRAEALFTINSVRGWVRLELVD